MVKFVHFPCSFLPADLSTGPGTLQQPIVLPKKWHQAGLSFRALKKTTEIPKQAKDPAECISLFLDSHSVYYINPNKKLSPNFTQKFEALPSSSEESNEDEEFLEIF